MSSTERSRKFREKLKNDEERLEAYRRTDRERKKRDYEKAKSTLSEKEKLKKKLKKREMQRSWRAKKKSLHLSAIPKKPSVAGSTPGSSTDGTLAGTFQSPQSLGKAVQKVKKSLPHSPSKIPHVIAKVVQGMSPGKRKAVLEVCDTSVKRRKLEGTNRKKRSDALSDEVVKEIKDFYLRDDISRMCPGRKDFISVKTPGGRQHMQKRLLLLNISEAYEIFKQESKVSVGMSKFASLRPPQVVPITLHDQEVCMCKYHENIELLLEGLHNVLTDVPKTAEDLLLTTVCNPKEIKCMDRMCSACEVEMPVEELFQGLEESLPVSYFQWETSDDGRARKCHVDCTLADAREDLIAQLLPFGRHVYNIRRQFEELKYLKENLPHGEIIIQEDFAENFQIKHQREIMAAHWSNEMVTLFTAVVYYRDEEGELQHISYVVVSDEMSHDKASVYSFNSAIIENVKLVTKVNKVHYWSDGPSSQFKNRYNLSCILYHQKDFGSEATWSFYETAHGKGPCDGVGAEVKRAVWRSILQSNAVVSNAEHFYQTAQRVCKTINILYRSERKVNEVRENLQERWKECKAIPHTHAVHYVAKANDDSTVFTSKNSQFLTQDDYQEHILISLKFSTEDDSPTNTTSEKHVPKQIPKQMPKQMPASCSLPNQEKTNSSIKVEFGLPQHLTAKFNHSSSLTLPPHKAHLISSILEDQVKFKGNSIIALSDLKSLKGGHIKAEDNYLTNFTIDSYLDILQAGREDVTVFSWETFEKTILKRLLAGQAKLLEQDIILAPCNSVGSQHWFLVAVFPKAKLVAAFDSMSGAFIKPTAKAALQKMWNILKKADDSIDVDHWQFMVNKPCDIPQQTNGWDCGVFLCLYARCLVSGVMLDRRSILDYRKHMILELHGKVLLSTSASNIEVDQYYAVDYVNKYYVGRALSASESSPRTSFKFLHRVGAKKFDWPKRDDVDHVHNTCIFYGPVMLKGNSPFEIPGLDELEAVFRSHSK